MSTTQLPPCTHQAQNVKTYLDTLADITRQFAASTTYKMTALSRLDNLINLLQFEIDKQKAASTATPTG